MTTHADKNQESKNQSLANGDMKNPGGVDAAFQFVDNRQETLVQRQQQDMADESPQVKQLVAFQQLADTNQQPVQLRHDTFNKQNMIFATSDPARMPSFYFSTDGQNSWRVRQQHDRGPTIEKKGTNVKHYFFADKARAEEFFDAARANDLPGTQAVEKSEVPQFNYNHVEFKNGNLTTAHISGGTIIPPGYFDYDDDDYEKMAASVGAWKEAEREKPGFSGRKDRREYTDTTVENALGVLSRDEYKTKIKTKGERDFDSLAKISAFTIQGKEEYKDELTQILNESEGAVDGAQEENLGTVVTKYMDKLQALYESVE